MYRPDDMQSWVNEAECKGLGRYFYAPGTYERQEVKLRRIKTAKEICSQCVVRVECLEYALNHHEREGVWGGLDEDERAGISRPRRQLA